MVSVATSLDVPIKLLWPKSISFASERGFTMLGLGDIVIPGVFVALALRYDHHRYSKSSPQASFTKPYFYSALAAYIFGLALTMTVMHVFGKAQPALLYLRSAILFGYIISAFTFNCI
jgi:minor histocompatibility antigen H13